MFAICHVCDHIHVPIINNAVFVIINLQIMQHGQTKEEVKLAIHWETQENIELVEQCVQYLTKGCKCRKG